MARLSGCPRRERDLWGLDPVTTPKHKVEGVEGRWTTGESDDAVVYLGRISDYIRTDGASEDGEE